MEAAYLKLAAALRSKLGWAHPHGSGGRVFIDTICPRCHKKKLSVNASSGMYRCWRECGSGHIRDILGAGFKLNKVETYQHEPDAPPRFISPGYMRALTSLEAGHPAIEYLCNRKYDPAYLERAFGVSYCEEGEWFGRVKDCDGGRYNTTNTLMFPIREKGKLLGWQSRLLYDPDKLTLEQCYEKGMVCDPEDNKLLRFPKYFTMPGLRKGEILFNFDRAKESNVVVVTEGVFDVFGVGKCGVATLGKGISPVQQSMLAQNWELALLLLDPDAKAENQMLKAGLNRQGMPAICVTLEDGTDAGSTPRPLLWQHIYKTCNKAGIDLCKYNINIEG